MAEQTAPVPPPLAPAVHSLSPISTDSDLPSLLPLKAESSTVTTVAVRERAPSESNLRRSIVQDISVRMTSALQTALESLLDEPTSDDSFERIDSNPPSPATTRKSKRRTKGKGN